MTWALIVGNGLTVDAARHCGLEISPNRPWNWPIKNPYDDQKLLIDVMPRLKEYLISQGNLSDLCIYEPLKSIVEDTQSRPPMAPHQSIREEDYIHLEACHFLRIAYAWYSKQIDREILKNWHWTHWLRQNGSNLVAVLSYNYDTVLESALRLAGVGIIYPWSRQNAILGPGLVPTEAELYVDEQPGDQAVIPIAKPHGSSNFSGWVMRQVSDENGIRPLYPIDGVMSCRDSTLKILENEKVFEATSNADLVLPGEWSCWKNDESTRVEWAAKQKEFFVEDAGEAQNLMVVGFGNGLPDQPEFEAILGGMKKFKKVHVVHPQLSPSPDLINALEKLSSSPITLWSEPPTSPSDVA